MGNYWAEPIKVLQLMAAAIALAAPAYADDTFPDLSDAGYTWIGSPTGNFDSYPGYIEGVKDLFLAPLGDDDGAAIDLPTSYNYATDVPQGEQQIVDQVLTDNPTATHPDVFFGYSDSSVQMSGAEELLHEAGICSQCVDFVFVGDTSAPDGYIANFLDNPSIEPIATALGYGPIEGIVTPDNLFPTEIITINGDEFADYQDAGIFGSIIHEMYLGLTPEEIASGAVTTEGLTTYINITLDSTQQWDALVAAFDTVFGL